MSEHPKCREVLDDLQSREQKSPHSARQVVAIGENVKLHRLVRAEDIDHNVGKPSKSTFNDFGLSVLVESSTYSLDIAKEVQERDRFVGAVYIEAKFVENLGYTIHLDPYLDPSGRVQHPNHAQVICNKTQGITKKIRDHCEWSVPPGAQLDPLNR